MDLDHSQRSSNHPAVGGSCRAYVADLLTRPDDWLPLVRFDAGRRWYTRVTFDEHHEIWLLSWLPGETTGFHDHATSAGAFGVALGALRERSIVFGHPATHDMKSGEVRAFGSDHIHEVSNVSDAPAVSIHAYSPPLVAMNRYAIHDGRTNLVSAELASDW